jgi:SAM-dependent methyltransferase
MPTDISELYAKEVELKYGKAGERGLQLGDVLEIARTWQSYGWVLSRCVEYLEMHPYRTMIDSSFPELYDQIREGDSSLLEVGCFMGQDIRKLVKDGGLKGNAVGIDCHPYHILVGFLLHNDSPEGLNFISGDAIALGGYFKDKSFDYVYSQGLIHSLQSTIFIPQHLSEVRKVLKDGGLMFGNTLSKREFGQTPSAVLPNLLSEEQLKKMCLTAGFKDVKIEEIPMQEGNDEMIKAKYMLYFQAR